MISYLVNLLFFFLPESRLYAFKRALLRISGAKIGNNVRVMKVKVQGIKLFIGDNTFIGGDCNIVGGKSNIIIGKNCDISSRVNIVSGTHSIGSIEHAAGECYAEDIIIEDGVWVGFGVTILHGVTIGKGSIIAAGSVVTSNIPSGVLPLEFQQRLKKSYSRIYITSV